MQTAGGHIENPGKMMDGDLAVLSVYPDLCNINARHMLVQPPVRELMADRAVWEAGRGFGSSLSAESEVQVSDLEKPGGGQAVGTLGLAARNGLGHIVQLLQEMGATQYWDDDPDAEKIETWCRDGTLDQEGRERAWGGRGFDSETVEPELGVVHDAFRVPALGSRQRAHLHAGQSGAPAVALRLRARAPRAGTPDDQAAPTWGCGSASCPEPQGRAGLDSCGPGSAAWSDSLRPTSAGARCDADREGGQEEQRDGE
eukprot:1180197-Rhodomonas_salina.1